jgi:hypothetical protein
MGLLGALRRRFAGDQSGLDEVRLALGALQARHARSQACTSLRDAEFRCFSQWGEDGILQYLVSRVPVADTSFVEFGVGNYAESNTRFLLQHDNWRGLILDGGKAHLDFVAQHGLDWRHDLTSLQAFVTRENINALLEEAGFHDDIGLLSVDIDGNDYWVLEAIQVVTPRILAIEYNSIFGATLAVTVPYQADFARGRSHYSHLHAGASLAAVHRLASARDYVFVGGNAAGNNAFFVRRDVAHGVREVTVEAGYTASRFRESRGPDGALTFLGPHRARLEAIADCPLWDLDGGQVRTVRELFLGDGGRVGT